MSKFQVGDKVVWGDTFVIVEKISSCETMIMLHGSWFFDFGQKIYTESDKTDYCTDIRNHLSPLTKVIER